MNTTSKVGLKGLTDQNTLGRDIMKGSYVNFEFPHNNIRMFINTLKIKLVRTFRIRIFDPDSIISKQV